VSRSLALELASKEIRVLGNRTWACSNAADRDDSGAHRARTARVPMGKVVQPEDVAPSRYTS